MTRTNIVSSNSETAAPGSIPSVSILLRIEGGVAGSAAVAAYAFLGAPWWLFAALLLVPDIAMLGYVRSPRTGAALYNLVHNYLGPALLAGFGFGMHQPLAMAIAAIWVAHIGLDRAMGFGLKIGDFQHTHLSTPFDTESRGLSRRAPSAS